jgi:surface polysaccharide O-acyltransferase-like enzyme
VDAKRWIGLDIFENFNDVFFMSLMFLIGGLFLSKSIIKKGTYTFLKDRFYRLFIPFLFGGTLLMLIAYFPSYYKAHNSTDIVAYIKDFFVVEKWPVGPPWFIWVLFLFNLVFALLYSISPAFFNRFGKRLSKIHRPVSFFAILFSVTGILYVPVAYTIGAGTWTGIGPFDFQLSRILLYFGYFLLGVFIGNTDFNTNLFSTESGIVKKWWLWILLALTVYAILTIISGPLAQWVAENKIKEFNAWMIYYTIYTASCVLSSIAFITFFRKQIDSHKTLLGSLSRNAYLIYLIHYVFVIWCQFLLMKFNIPAIIKFSMTFILTLSLSWIASILLRKIKIINSYL